MTSTDLDKIEQTLGLRLPADYRTLMTGDSADRLVNSGLFTDAGKVIERTLEQRNGFGGAPPWPARFVYLGDQEDACPYALDCTSGRVTHSDHGRLDSALGTFESVSLLAQSLATEDSEQADGDPAWWKFWRR
jgi:hypothetical protein